MPQDSIFLANLKFVEQLDKDAQTSAMQIINLCHDLNYDFEVISCKGCSIQIKPLNCEMQDVLDIASGSNIYFYL